ncbi:MAG: heparan-alpha-glucosaminide N-acetyltransferase domain-containing protein [Bacteroidota bacterium]
MKRLVALDFFRGLTIALMVVVNTPGSWSYVYPPLRHAEWHGATPTDLVFPFFLFIVGVSIALAYSKKKAAGAISSSTYRKIIRRAVTLFALGLFLALFPKFNFGNIRVVGVLQRIAIVFLICSILYLKLNWKNQLRVGIGCLISYWVMMKFLPFSGGEVGQLDPGVNFAAWVDRYITPGRMYQKTWDPEGFFSTIPSVGTGIFGMLTGQLVLHKNLSQHRKIIWLFTIGFLTFLAGIVWGWHFPINKHIWTSSYVLYCGGLSSMFLAASIWLVDELGYQNWFTHMGVVFGMNAIAAYVLHGIIWRLFQIPIGDLSIQRRWMTTLPELGLPPELASLMWAVSYMLLIYLIVLLMYRRKIFLKV